MRSARTLCRTSVSISLSSLQLECVTVERVYVCDPPPSLAPSPSRSWYGTIQLKCPWVMLINASAGQAVTFSVTNSGQSLKTWSSNVSSNMLATPYRWGAQKDPPHCSSAPHGFHIHTYLYFLNRIGNRERSV